MKIKYLLLPIFIILLGCSDNDDTVDYATINGTVERLINGEGIPGQQVTVMTRKSNGSGLLATIEGLDRKEVVTDANGNFSVALVTGADAYITIIQEGDENYSGSSALRDYPIDEPIIIKIDKYIKFKISVRNTSPIDENDFILIDFVAGGSNVMRTAIENFGVQNTSLPAEQLPGGGTIGPSEETSWKGTDVNSDVYYSVPETAEYFKIRWQLTKNGIETEGFTNNIPYAIDQVNPFSFDY